MRPSAVAFTVAALLLATAVHAHAAQTTGAKDPSGDIPVLPGPPRTGHIEDDLKDARGNMVIHYAMDTPATLPKERTLAVIVAFHGNTHTAEHHAGVWKNVVVTGKADQEYVVFALKSQGTGWGNVDDVGVTKAIDWVLAAYPIDRRRVHLVGFSSGSSYCGTYGLKHQERFATLSMYCCGFGVAPLPNNDRESAPGIYMMFGTADGFLPGTPGRDMRNQLHQAGYRYINREIQGGGHDFGPGDTITQDNLRWMHQNRSRHVPLEPDQEKFVKSARDAKGAEKVWASAQSANQALYIGGHWAQAMALKAHKAKSSAARLNVAKAASAGLFGVDMIMALGQNLSDKSAELRKQSITSLAPAANWCWPEAKTLLVQFASEPKNALDERLGAVQALADALVRIGLAEKYDDNILVPGLVKLLDDAKEPIRAAAFAALSQVQKDGFGYNPAAADRKGPLAAWQAWANEKCGFYSYDPPAKAK
ncbi:MAG: hypothetical protein H0W72_15860 [Planctomycetes bacterium]|nr:hypothetical protein [Planctomycetota bacterium]